MNPEAVRSRYREALLDERAVFPSPLTQFKRWFTEAKAAEVQEAYAMTLASVSADGRPSARTVLLKALDTRGFVFYSSGGRKALELVGRDVSLLFFWPELERQVRIEGRAERLLDSEADAYFAARPRTSQLCAWAFTQSAEAADRAALEAAFDAAVTRFDGVKAIPRPPQWGGYRVVPDRVEFWQGRLSRLHDRILYTRTAPAETNWTRMRLAP